MPSHLLIQKLPDGSPRVNVGLLYPPFLERLIVATGRAMDRGAGYFWVRGFATWAEQHQLRMLYLAGKGGKAAPAGYSAHNYGLGTDFTFDVNNAAPGLQPSWKAAEYAILGEELTRVGLVWGKSFGDLPHANWPGFVSGAQLEPLRKIWNIEAGDNLTRLQAVWKYVDTHSPHLQEI